MTPMIGLELIGLAVALMIFSGVIGFCLGRRAKRTSPWAEEDRILRGPVMMPHSPYRGR